MRALTSVETTALQAASRKNVVRVEIANGNGTLVDYSEYFIGGSLPCSVDQPVVTANIELKRGNWLSPLMEGSELNRLNDGVNYAPAVNGGRAIRISVGTSLPDGTPTAHRVFRGVIDDVDAGPDALKISARDPSYHLQERFVEEESLYEQAPMHQMIQAILDDWTDGVTLYSINGTAATPYDTADGPDYVVNQTKFDGQSVWETLESITQLNGWLARYRWNESVGAFVLTLYTPARDRVMDPADVDFTAEWTFQPSRYFDVTTLRVGKRGVRNAVGGHYYDASGTKHVVPTIEDATSVQEYGRQFLAFREGKDSPINTLAEFQAMQEPALADLKDPKADHEILAPLFWPVELNDIYLFKANGVHYDTDQAFAVVGYRHDLGQERTTIQVRGHPSGGYRSWLERWTGSGIDDPQNFVRVLDVSFPTRLRVS